MSFDLINIANQDESWALLPSDPGIVTIVYFSGFH